VAAIGESVRETMHEHLVTTRLAAPVEAVRDTWQSEAALTAVKHNSITAASADAVLLTTRQTGRNPAAPAAMYPPRGSGRPATAGPIVCVHYFTLARLASLGAAAPDQYTNRQSYESQRQITDRTHAQCRSHG
jgi:hypothetical protein